MEAFFSADAEHLSLKWISDSLYSDHVPLYFWIYRIIAFFCFKGSSTLWTGYSINIFFYSLFLLCAYGFWQKVTKKPILSAGIVLVSSIVNKVMIAQITILRMYMMLVFAEMILMIVCLKILKDKNNEKLKFSNYFLLFVVSVFGFLTHYDYWIFYAVTAAIFCAWLVLLAIRKKKAFFWKSIEFRCVVAWIGNFICSLLLTIIIFPYCRWNLNRDKGKTALNSIFMFSLEKLKNILWGFKRLSISIFGESMPFEIGILILFCCIIGAVILLYRAKELNKMSVLCFMVSIALVYQMIVCFTFPAGNEERYLWGNFTLIHMCFVWSGYLILDKLLNGVKKIKKVYVLYGVSLCFTIVLLVFQWNSIDMGRGIPYLFHPQKDMEALESKRELHWVVYGSVEDVYSYYDWLIPNQICFLSQNNTVEDREAVLKLEEIEEFVLYTYPAYFPQAMEFLDQQLKGKYTGEKLTQSTNMEVYIISKN